MNFYWHNHPYTPTYPFSFFLIIYRMPAHLFLPLGMPYSSVHLHVGRVPLAAPLTLLVLWWLWPPGIWHFSIIIWPLFLWGLLYPNKLRSLSCQPPTTELFNEMNALLSSSFLVAVVNGVVVLLGSVVSWAF